MRACQPACRCVPGTRKWFLYLEYVIYCRKKEAGSVSPSGGRVGEAITTTKEQIKNIESQLTTSISPEDLQTLQSKIQTNIDLHKRDTETRKRNKFARDLQDYEQNRVYRWRDNPSTNKYTHRTAKSSTDYTSSGSDMDQRQSTIQSVPFLGQTRRRPNRRRRGEAIGTRGNLDFTRITRSQTHNW
ncbi:uncharacterized protein [Phyllobates terribilis]|uniref:uncharacterized protein isoform X3 n=1 Tax=Phyllobates terribilis TaxID=111132 RepID=UPI003CCB675D